MPAANLRLILTKYRFLIPPFLVGSVILILTVMLLIPKINQIFQTRQALSREKEKLVKLTQKVADLEGLDEVELSTKANLMMSALPAEKDVPRILATLSSLGSETEVRLGSIEVTPGELSTASGQPKKKELPGLSFKISAGGSMEAIKSFLDRIGSSIPVMQISEVSLKRAGGEVAADVSFDAYFLPLPESLGAAESLLVKITPDEEITYKKIERFKTPLVEKVLPSVGSGKENLFSF